MAGSGDCAGGSTVGVELALGAARMRRRPTRAARGEGLRVNLLNGGRAAGTRVVVAGAHARECACAGGAASVAGALRRPGGCGRRETEPAARASRAARGQGAPVWRCGTPWVRRTAAWRRSSAAAWFGAATFASPGWEGRGNGVGSLRRTRAAGFRSSGRKPSPDPFWWNGGGAFGRRSPC